MMVNGLRFPERVRGRRDAGVSSWPRLALASLGTVITGSTPRTSEDHLYGGELPFVTPAELGQSNPVVTAPRTLTEDGRKKARVVPEGSVMVSCIGSLGKVGIAGRPLATNQQINSVVFDPQQIWPRFGFHACRLLKSKLQAMAPATTVPIVSKSRFERLEILCPPLEEQRRIAEILDAVDWLRAKRRAATQRLGSLKRSIFLEMFGTPRAIMERWRTAPLGELLEFMTSGSRGWARYYSDVGDLFLRIQNIGEDEFLREDATYVDPPDSAEVSRTRVQEGDVILSITADLGRTMVVPAGLGPAYINQHLAILRTKNLDPRYLSMFLSSPTGQRQIQGRNRGASKAGLNFDDVRSLVIPLPPSDLQHEFATRLQIVDRLIMKERVASTRSLALMTSVRERAFAGAL